MGALGLYHKAIRKTELAGPTYFAGMLKRFLNMIEFEREKYEKTYFVLMILTDGCIHDMPETKQLIVELSYQPCSIVIIGIGEEDFTFMETLDADTMVLVDNIGRPAARDIVQFVKFNDLSEMARVEVQELMLEEIPDQFVDYMVAHAFYPESFEEMDSLGGEDIGFNNYMKEANSEKK